MNSDISPARVYITAKGIYKLSGFSFADSGKDDSLATCYPSSHWYSRNPIGAGSAVVNLGKTLLQLATLDLSIRQDTSSLEPLISQLHYSKTFKGIIRSMIHNSTTLADISQALHLPSPSAPLHTRYIDVVTERRKTAQRLLAQREYEQAAGLLTEAWNGYMTRGDPVAVEVGVELAYLLSVHLCDFEKAKAVIRHVAQDMDNRENVISLEIRLIEAAYFTQDYEEVEAIAFPLFTSSITIDQYLSLCFFIAESRWNQCKKAQISEITDALASQPFTDYPVLSQFLLFHLQAREQECQSNWSEAALLRSQAQELLAESSQCFPLNLLKAVNYMNLALAYVDIGRHSEAFSAFEQANSVLELDFPVCLITGRNLYNWGNALRAIQQLEKCVKKYQKAYEILSTRYKTSLETAQVLSNLGLSLATLQKHDIAVEKYGYAENLFCTYYPNSEERAINLMNWALLFQQQEQFSNCPQLLEGAYIIFSSISPDSLKANVSLFYLGKTLVECGKPHEALAKLETAYFSLSESSFAGESAYYLSRALAGAGRLQEAIEKYAESYSLRIGNMISDEAVEHLIDWGNCLFSLGNYTLSVEKYEAADTILQGISPSPSITMARNLYNWANALSSIGQPGISLTKHELAHSILSSCCPSALITAQNLLNWGKDLYDLGQFPEAVKKFTSAKSIFKRKYPKAIDAGRNLMNLGVGLFRVYRIKEALKRHESAHFLLSTHFPTSIDKALNLLNWGNALCNLQIFAAACEKYEAANSLLLRLFPASPEIGIVLHFWGNCLLGAGKTAEAMGKYREADGALAGKCEEFEIRNKKMWGEVWEWDRSQEQRQYSTDCSIFGLPRPFLLDSTEFTGEKLF